MFYPLGHEAVVILLRKYEIVILPFTCIIIMYCDEKPVEVLDPQGIVINR